MKNNIFRAESEVDAGSGSEIISEEVNPSEIRNSLAEADETIYSMEEEQILEEVSQKSGFSKEKISEFIKKEGFVEKLSALKKEVVELKKKLGVAALLGATLIAGVPSLEASGISGKESEESVVEKTIKIENGASFEVDKIKRAPIVDKEGMSVSALEAQYSPDQIERKTYGAAEANYWVDQLGLTKDTAVIQDAIDHYYLNCPAGTSDRWGDGWLNKFILNLFVKKSHELESQLTQQQKEQIDIILADAIREQTFFIDSTCGIDPGNSCSEDFVSYLDSISRIKNFFPGVVQKVGEKYVNDLEQKYLQLTFSTDYGNYSLVRENTLDGAHVLMHNHEGQNAVYTGLLLIYLNQALEAYNETNTPIPLIYRQDWLLNNIKDMFAWLQSVSTSDGESFLMACKGTDGNMDSCADIRTANAIPKVIPAGRIIHNFVSAKILSPDVFKKDCYDYRDFDLTYHGGNIDNRGRQEDYNVDNLEFTPTFVQQEVTHIIRRHLSRGK